MVFDKFPRVQLGYFPTPIEELTRLSDLLDGPRIFIKRDDCTGLALGGNKVRKLEFLVGDALSLGADTLITAGAPQSNHCRQTAAAAARLGLACHLVLGGEEPEKPTGNLLLDIMLGATLHFAGPERKGESLQRVASAVQSSGHRPYIIPYGGSNATGAMGFVAAMQEFARQLDVIGGPVDRIVFPSSSGGTHAGLVAGAAMSGFSGKVTGIRIDKDEPSDKAYIHTLMDLGSQVAERLGITGTFHDVNFDLIEDYVGEGYGIPGALEREAISLLARAEGILLDPVYTGRAMAGLIGLIRRGEISPSERILFWHTGGAPALFAYPPETFLEMF